MCWRKPRKRRSTATEFSRDKTGKVREETALDVNGAAIWKFIWNVDHSAGLYLDRQNYPRPRYPNCATHVAIVWTEAGQPNEVRFTSSGGLPRPNAAGAFGCQMLLDGDGLWREQVFLTQEGNPGTLCSGAAKVRVLRDKLGNITEASYWNLANAPAVGPAFVHKIVFRHDENGNVRATSFSMSMANRRR